MSTKVHSSKGSTAPEVGAGDAGNVGEASLPSPSVAAPASSGVSLAPSAPGSLPSVKKKKKSKKGTRKSKAHGANGALDLTPSTAAPAVGVGVARSGATAAAANDEDADDISVPPAEDLDHDFFRASEAPPPVSRRSYEPAHEVETRDPRIEQLMTAEVKRRRAHFAKYVKAAVAISLVLCLAAVIRVGIRRNHSDDSTSAMAATQVRPAPVVVVPEPATVQKPIDPPPPPAATDTAAAAEPTMTADPVAAPATSAEVAKAPEPTPSASAIAVASAAPEPSAAPSAVASAVAASDPAAFDPKEAAKEKRKSQQLLDQGKIKDAIEHGEVSVKLDPTDAEAWLILGAAYQMKGDIKEAKRCFGSCIKEGKRGPKGECMAMPH